MFKDTFFVNSQVSESLRSAGVPLASTPGRRGGWERPFLLSRKTLYNQDHTWLEHPLMIQRRQDGGGYKRRRRRHVGAFVLPRRTGIISPPCARLPPKALRSGLVQTLGIENRKNTAAPLITFKPSIFQCMNHTQPATRTIILKSSLFYKFILWGQRKLFFILFLFSNICYIVQS